MLRCGSVADPQRSRRSLASHAKRAISFLYVLFVLPCIASDRLRDPLCKAKSYQASWRLSADTGANGRRSKVIAGRFYDADQAPSVRLFPHVAGAGNFMRSSVADAGTRAFFCRKSAAATPNSLLQHDSLCVAHGNRDRSNSCRKMVGIGCQRRSRNDIVVIGRCPG